jgi:predicted nucleotidyltransferase
MEKKEVRKMYPEFLRTIEDYIVPISKLNNNIWDSTYFMREDDSLVFCEGYCHPEGSLYGKIIYYPSEETGNVNIHGRPYECITKKFIDDEIIYVSHPDQIRRQCELDPTLRKDRPPFAEYELEFPFNGFIGYFDCRKSLGKAMKTYPKIGETAHMVSDLLEVPLDEMGVTGSLAYGVYDPNDEDFDVVFYGTVEENRRVVSKIFELTTDPGRQVIEYGKLWPMRFHNNKVLVCPFFVYSDWDEIPLKDFNMQVLRKRVVAEGTVCEDRHSIYMPAIVQLDNLTIDGEKSAPKPLIIYDGALRGDFMAGDKLRCYGMLVRITNGREDFDALMINLYNQIEKL